MEISGLESWANTSEKQWSEPLLEATWDQNWIQRGELLPAPTPDLFARAGAILATRAARGGATDEDLTTIIARSSAQAARLVVEGAPSASAEKRGQRHGP